MLIFRDATIDEIRAAALAQFGGKNLPRPGVVFEDVKRSLTDYRDAVAGGDRCRRFLVPFPDEDPLIQEMRFNSFQNIPLTERIVDEQSAWSYGKPPKRNFVIEGIDEEDPRVKELNDDLNGVYMNQMGTLFFRRRVIPASFRDQWTFSKVRFDPRMASLGLKAVRFSHLTREYVIPVRDPADSDTYLGVVEVRPMGGSAYSAQLYTMSKIGYIDEAWNWRAPEANEEDYGKPFPQPNPLGMIPHVCFGSIWGDHQLADALWDQKALINMRSWELMGWRAQAAAIYVLEGDMVTPEEPSSADGGKRTRINPAGYIQLQLNGKFYAVNSDFKIKEIREAEASMLVEAAQHAKISPGAVDAARIPEAPMALALKMTTPMQDRDLNIEMFSCSEMCMADLVVKIASLRKLIPYSPEQIESRITFPTDVLPIDKMLKRTADQLDVREFREKAEDYIAEYIRPGDPLEKILAYWKELESRRTAVEVGTASTMRDLLAGGRTQPGQATADRMATLYGGAGPNDTGAQPPNGEGPPAMPPKATPPMPDMGEAA